jgi:hypothetical protein
MRTDYKIILFTIAATIITFLGIWFYEALIPIGLSPIHIWGYSFLAIIAFGLIFTEVMAGKSPQFINESVFSNINKKEIRLVPWNNELVQVTDKNNEEIKDPKMMAVIPLGGIDYWGFNPESSSDKTLVIQPYEDLQKIGLCYRSITTLYPYFPEEIPPDLRHFCERTLGKRFTDCKTILFGLTNHIDGSTNPRNERVMFQKSKENAYINQLEKTIDKLYKEKRRENKEREKTVYVKPAGTIEEGD